MRCATAQEPSPWERPESAKALWESLGLSLGETKDREKPSDAYLELYLRVLTRLRQLPISVVSEWTAELPLVKAIEEAPANFRGQLFRVEGLLVSMDKVELPAELADRFNLNALYKLQIRLDGVKHENSESPGRESIGKASGPRIEVWCTQIPSGLADHRHHGEGLSGTNRRVAVDGVFLLIDKWAPKPDSVFHSAIFVANRLQWFPETFSDILTVTPSTAALGEAHFDVGLLDSVREETAKRLTAEVTEPFLQLLAAQPRVDWASLEAQPLPLAKLVSQPRDFVGEAIEFDAVARRVVEIAIDDARDRKRLGINRYFQIDAVLPKPIRTLVKDKDGATREIEQPNFPVTICTTEAPKGLAIGADLRESIHVRAFFFKLWAYESKFAEAQSDDTMQVSPLFVARSVAAAPPPETDSRSLWWVVGGAIGILGLISVWGYLLLRSDDLQQRQTKSISKELAAKNKVSQLGEG